MQSRPKFPMAIAFLDDGQNRSMPKILEGERSFSFRAVGVSLFLALSIVLIVVLLAPKPQNFREEQEPLLVLKNHNSARIASHPNFFSVGIISNPNWTRTNINLL